MAETSNSLVGFKVIIDFLKIVLGFLVGVVGAVVLVSLAFWHLFREVDRIERELGE